ncbi:amidohydrolase [Streptomyces mobaraensis NBRC 13819 = DSM 40847]|uniref:Amidohydrolase n=2 Tax=Streptomyces mobaraensis TaxID=35621 RepID=A0A5N5WER4_STRMB|nr:amidohydrolase [Streptomyces mobaraensis]EMF00250.1 amidohydrolase [Streptomyces mobaraensis NBRC 13819 = DSM 40847]KAB7852450.1 amidohydrolase [Streptomyces mobaraensis]QTT75374.1 amidohydrolase [Streptomyces mobaraensis NBRC 13819 = DSM 40847]
MPCEAAPETSVDDLEGDLAGALPGRLPAELRAELIAFRRDLHMHPELGHREFRTTAALRARLEKAGLRPRTLASGTGLICDIGRSRPGASRRPVLAFRADLDALPIPDTKQVPYRSTVPGAAHACGHDVHTTVVLGAGLVLAALAEEGLLPHPVRLIFQPSEEVLPGGALDAIEDGALDGVGRIVAVHCDPKVEVGRIGLRTGPITSACDKLEVALDGPGGHTARPHLTTDLVTAAAKVATEVPALLARRIDTRAGLAVTWGRLEAGHAANVIPQRAELSGTVRCLDIDAWRDAPDLVHAAVDEVAAMHRAKSQITYIRGVPPVVNDGEIAGLLGRAMTARRGADAVEDTQQSLGGEDFSWYLERVPGAMARLGVRPVGDSKARDLHRGDFDVDEGAIQVGVELFTAAALLDRNQM